MEKEIVVKRTISRRTLLKTGCTATAGLTLSGTAISRSAVASQTTDSGHPIEWRNRQTGMSYRRLGRTGYMVSEFVMGGNTISPTNNKHVELAVEMGLNYFDTSPAYGSGNSEKGYGELLKRSYFREKVFVNSKVSIFDSKRNEFYWNLYQDLGDDGKKKIEHEVNEGKSQTPQDGLPRSVYVPARGKHT